LETNLTHAEENERGVGGCAVNPTIEELLINKNAPTENVSAQSSGAGSRFVTSFLIGISLVPIKNRSELAQLTAIV
jgi:hypothetical protein